LVNQLEDKIESIEETFDARSRLLRDRIAARLARNSTARDDPAAKPCIP